MIKCEALILENKELDLAYIHSNINEITHSCFKFEVQQMIRESNVVIYKDEQLNAKIIKSRYSKPQ